MRELKKTAIAAGVAQAILLASGVLSAQAAFAADNEKADTATVVVVGQRAALESAQKRKQNSDEIVDSVVADDIGKLPDKSVTEVLQRISGVTIDRTLNRADPQQGVGDGINHFAAEGTGVSIRGLSLVRSELNGRDSFSANGGRSLSFEDVPPELMSGVDVYKNPSAEQIEGGIGGLVNLRTALPFDFKGRKISLSVEAARSALRGKNSPSFSGLVSDRWDTGFGQFGALLDLAHSRIETRSDGMQISTYIPRTDLKGENAGKLRWISPGGSWTSNNFERDRDGLYGALQWKKDTLSSSLTFFRSKYKMHTEESAVFASSNPATLELDPGAIFNEQGVMRKGTLRAPTEPGVGFGTDARASARDADTRDLSWNLTWRASSQLQLSTDLQRTRATTSGWDNTIGLNGYTPKQTLDLTTSPVGLTFDAADRARFADPNNYYWGFAQEHRDHAVATQTAARVDAKYIFDSPVLNDVRFGVRFTDRDAETRSTHDSEWAQITQGWAVGDSWQPLNSFAYLKDPRFAGNTGIRSFANFFGGKVALPPNVVVPNMALTEGTPPSSFAMLHGYTKMVCKDPCPAWIDWSPAPYGDDKGLNGQHERTKAAYGQLRFSFDDLPYPVDGNVGLRVVRTDMSATGYTLFTPPTSKLPGVPSIAAQSEKQSFDNSYTNALPSLNLRMKSGSDLQFRAAFSKGMTRPDFYQMQAYTTLEQKVNSHTVGTGTSATEILDSVEYKGSARGNPMLRPTQSNNVDLTAEWYFGRSNSLTMAVFNKQLKDIIIGQTTYYTLKDTVGAAHDFQITAPVNGAKGRATGVEIGYQQYFDKLPGLLSGFGVSGNYTYIDSRLNLNRPVSAVWCTPSGTVDANLARDLAGCDTDGHILGGVPMTGLSKNAFNFALLYDQGPVSSRLAYSWRSKYLQAVNAYGTAGGDGIDQNPASPNKGGAYTVNYALPTWGGAYGQLDLGVHYKVMDNFTVAFEAQNLTNALYKQYMQQQIGLMERGAFYTGRRYTLQARYSF